MRLVSVGSVLALTAASLVIGTTPANAVSTDVWTEAAHTSVFRDSRPSGDAGRTIRLDAARNEFEAGQVVLRRDEAFSIDAVDPSALTGPSGTIAAGNVSYNFVDYENLDSNTYNPAIYPTVRTGAGLYPDRLTNERSKPVAARSTQSIWVRVFVPAATAAGSYTGSVQVVTNKGTITVPVSVNVRAVTLPESNGGAFNTTLWQLFTGNISWDEGRGETVELPDVGYGYPRYSTQWWALMENVARMMKQYRTNGFAIPVVRHLIDAGSRPDGSGGWVFDWSRFDQVVEFMMSRGVVKRLEGFWQASHTKWSMGPGREVEVIHMDGGRPVRAWVESTSAEGQSWISKYVPALRDHIRAKGWEPMFWMHVGDEPQHGEIADWRGIADRIRAHWPQVKLGDAVDLVGVHPQIVDHTDLVVSQIHVYDADRAFYDQKRAEGKELWFYNSTAPRHNYLNRFIDQPQWHQRMLMWHAYGRGATGYLHWAMNNWQYAMNAQDAKGDGLIVRPDKERNTVEVSTRYESLRDGAEDYEMLSLLGRVDPGLARGLAESLVQRSDKYTPDIAYMQRIRALTLDAAAGKPISPDLARGVAATASSGDPALAVDGNPATAWQPASGTQWLRLDLGRQIQLDGVRLRWTSVQGTAYKIQTSYDGSRWTDTHSTSAGDFVGLNGKARYVRLEISGGGGLTDLEISGFALAKTNLAGGRTYTKSVAPNNQPDTSEIESTDGVLADAWDDGRTYGYQAPTGPVTVTIDLGSIQPVDNVKLHAYEEYPAYRPDSVRVATSLDGVSFTQRGVQLVPRGPSGIWYDVRFPPAAARHVQVTFTKTYGGDASALLIDEIEVYAAGAANVAAARPYVKTRPAPTDPAYPDTASRESTDGLIAGGFNDGRGYGYRLATPGQTVTVDVTLDLGSSRSLSQVRAAKYNDGVRSYEPNTVRVYAGDDPVSMTLRRETTSATGSWFELPVTVTARYVKVQFVKARTHDLADYLFIDEVQVLDGAATNVALSRTYTKTHPATPETAYPDTGDRESTDGIIAAGFADGHGYGYWMPTPGQTLTVEVILDLGVSRTIDTVRARAYDGTGHDYSPDSVTVFAGDDPFNLPVLAETGSPSDQWYHLSLPPTTGRFITVRFTKTRTHNFADYLFLDEITVS